MSILLSFNGSNYIIPQTNEIGWGSNLDAFFVAIPAGCLQKTGGSFTLSAETDLGGSFGLKSLYLKSRSTNPSVTGILRLANGDTVSWRNNLNTLDLPLSVNASDQLTFNGTPLALSSGSTLTASKVVITDAFGILTTSTVTPTTLSYLDIGSSLTTLLAGKEPTLTKGNLTETTSAILTISGGTSAVIGSGVTIAVQAATNSVPGYLTAADHTSFAGGVVTANAALPSTSFTNAAVTSKLITGYVSGSGTIFATDTILQAINKLDGNDGLRLLLTGGSLTGNLTLTNQHALILNDTAGTPKAITLKAPTTLADNYNFILPTNHGGVNQYLTDDGAGNLSWTNAAGTGTVNSGTQYQLGYYATSTNAISGNSNILTNASGQLLLITGTNLAPALSFAGDPNTGFYNPSSGQIRVTNNDINTVIFTDTGVAFLMPQTFFSDGSAAAPSITFSNDVNTGFYHFGTDILGISTDGAQRFSISNVNTSSYVPLRLIGAGPQLTFRDSSDSYHGLIDYDDAGSTAFIFTNDYGTGSTFFKIGSSIRMEITSTAVKSGGDNSCDLGISGNAWGNVYAYIYRGQNGTGNNFLSGDGSSSTPAYSFVGDADTGIFHYTTNMIGIVTGSTLACIVDSAQRFQFTDGSAAAPSITFINDSNTGLYWGGSQGNMGIALDGVQYAAFGTSSIYFKGQVTYDNGSVTVPTITFNNDTNLGIYRFGADILGIASGGGVSINGIYMSATNGGVDISSGGLSLMIGADTGASSRTNSTNKTTSIAMPHYSSGTEEPITLISAVSSSGANALSIGGGMATQNAASWIDFYTGANATTLTGTVRMTIDLLGNVIVGTAALATTATDGFLYIPTCAGVPTGVPSTKTGRCPMVYDTTNNKLYVYNSGWKGATHA